jgi:protein O-GlcNAc transferase
MTTTTPPVSGTEAEQMPAQLLATAINQHQAGDLTAAEQGYRAVLAGQPNSVGALAGLGALAGQLGRNEIAADYLARACALEPANAVFQHNYGEALRGLGQAPSAETAFRRAIELDSNLAPAFQSLLVLVSAAHAQAVANNDVEQAAALAWEIARLANNRGNALLASGQPQQAVASYRHALSVHADYAVAWSNLGNVLREEGRITDAEAACREAITLDPDCAPAWNNLGTALAMQARFGEAWPCYGEALAKQPDLAAAQYNRSSGSLANLLYAQDLSYTAIVKRHREWGADLTVSNRQSAAQFSNSRNAERVLRVGYLAPDARDSMLRHFIAPLLAAHDYQAFEIVCYGQGAYGNAETRQFTGQGERWVWVREQDDSALAAQIERNQIDILVDCAGHGNGSRLKALARKPAPIMLSWLGYLCATGLPAIDCRLTDQWVDPPKANTARESEALLRIPGGMMSYRPPETSPDCQPPPCLTRGHVTFGSLNDIRKINPKLILSWAQILKSMPDARLLLQGRLLVDAGMAGRVRGMFETYGIKPHRLDLRPARSDYLNTYHEIDVALDSHPYGGAATTCDALWMGVPVVTVAGERPFGRFAASVLNQIGHGEWATSSASAYVVKAVQLARNSDALTHTRTSLREEITASPLCDHRGFAKRLERVYQASWRAWLSNAVA